MFNGVYMAINPIHKKAVMSRLPDRNIYSTRWLQVIDLSSERALGSLATTRKVIDCDGITVMLGRWKQGTSDAADLLGKQLGRPVVRPVPALFGREVNQAVERSDQFRAHKPIVLLDNLALYEVETRNQTAARELAQNIVNDTKAEGLIIDMVSEMLYPSLLTLEIAKLIKTKSQDGVVALGIEAEQEINRVWDSLTFGSEKTIGFFGGKRLTGPGGSFELLKMMLPRVKQALIDGSMLYPFLAASPRIFTDRDPLAGKRGPGELEAEIAAARLLLKDHGDKFVFPPCAFGTGDDWIGLALSEIRSEGVMVAFVKGSFDLVEGEKKTTEVVLEHLSRLAGRGKKIMSFGPEIRFALARRPEMEKFFTFTSKIVIQELLSRQTLPGIEMLSEGLL
ncbi:phosphoglycerate kinase [candidate division WOR-1 bacterium RIFCSPHIGHO2_01_FULL_53_15]|uniref:Phosphoglycerate kinase n=1 Tax=candidate division WOR-1 bacterium RIFCSPHIGHO2_01_FULL_53_15 TaxID=1802564 RepID=A0A1F4PYT5_UNCSA|nr:MAG: phosphoglycerate kinase [candidate division WOR-1 bacterium RIFCSPHIGHO2_01_FULL_53_15]OGC10707.1 MAG: phosphoglycerate kinase [candidate division WOR-1 bacterium RIFCSPHIGHO2_02_FULL_53_26]